ncbi:MAG: hypothetical protein H6Q04_2937 [Acidobacteria bacterium]|nr:hypothetical protein [Acidobacteriota bacterium]
MANEQHLAQLKKVIDAEDMNVWNQWKYNSRNAHIDLSGANLHKANLAVTFHFTCFIIFGV